MASVVRKKPAGYLQMGVADGVLCLVTALVSDVPTVVYVDTCRSLDTGVIKFLSRVTLAFSMQVVSKAGNGSRSQYDGSKAD